jgi:hypothetical protein
MLLVFRFPILNSAVSRKMSKTYNSGYSLVVTFPGRGSGRVGRKVNYLSTAKLEHTMVPNGHKSKEPQSSFPTVPSQPLEGTLATQPHTMSLKSYSSSYLSSLFSYFTLLVRSTFSVHHRASSQQPTAPPLYYYARKLLCKTTFQPPHPDPSIITAPFTQLQQTLKTHTS